jgi:cytochrome bd ubiquinol oxidase subunit I
MDDAWFARAQMGLSLGFHIVFAAVGVAMPLLMVLAELRWLRRGDPVDLQLAKAWAKGTAVLFAVGAVSGTVLSFELGLLFPRFMEKAGAVIGPAFALEGAAFFVEAIFLGLFLYGWDRLKPAVHVACGAVVALSGLASAALVTLANAWMQAPVGVEVAPDGSWVNLDPIAALWSPAAPLELLHSIVAVYAATGLTVAGVHAWALRRSPGGAGEAFHRRGLGLALALAVPATLAQPVIGHAVGEKTARLQPLKLAAMEAQFRTERRASAGSPTTRRASSAARSSCPAACRSSPPGASTARCRGSRPSRARTGPRRSCTTPSSSWSAPAWRWPRCAPGARGVASGTARGRAARGRRSCGWPPGRCASRPSRRAGS